MKVINTLILLMSQGIIAQSTISPEEVIEKYLEAIGGRKKLKKIETLYKSGTQVIKGETHE